MVFFAHLFLLIYSSQKVPTSLKFYRALHILVLHMHRKFDVDSIDSFWDTEEQSTQSTRRKERKKERKKERITGNKKNIKVKNKKSHHYMMTFNKVLDHYLHHNLVMLLPLWHFLLIYFAHLLIAEGPQVTQILYSAAYSSPTYAQKIWCWFYR